MWGHPYRQDGNHIYYDLEWGLHFFVTDGRYHSNRDEWILGTGQCAWLRDGLKASQAQLKIIVFSSQFISENSDEGFVNAAPDERATILETIMQEVQGSVLIFSGDVHFSECQRYPEESNTPKIVEITSSPLRIVDKVSIRSPDSDRLWHTVEESFAVIEVTLSGGNAAVGDSLTIEAYDGNGNVLASDEPLGICRTVWNLLTGVLS